MATGINNPYRDSPPQPSTPLATCHQYKPRSLFFSVIAILAFVTIVMHKLLSTQTVPDINISTEKPPALRGQGAITATTSSDHLPPQIQADYSIHKSIPASVVHGRNSWPKFTLTPIKDSSPDKKPSEPSSHESLMEPIEVNSPEKIPEVPVVSEAPQVVVEDKPEKDIGTEIETKEKEQIELTPPPPPPLVPDVVEETTEAIGEKLEPTPEAPPQHNQIISIVDVTKEEIPAEPVAQIETKQENPLEIPDLSIPTERTQNQTSIPVVIPVVDVTPKPTEKLEKEDSTTPKATPTPTKPKEESELSGVEIEVAKEIKTDVKDEKTKLIISGYSSDIASSIWLWLIAETGVVVDSQKRVNRWVDQSPQTRSTEFAFKSLLPSRLVPANSALINEYRADIKRYPENADLVNPTSQIYTSYSPIDSSNKVAYVQFPCALASSNESLALDESFTYFFVIKHEYPGKDEKSPGQKFFGHYPSGEFKILKNQASFHANGADYLSPDNSLSLAPNQWNLLGYRLSRIPNKGVKVEISVNGRDFVTVSPSDWAVSEIPVLFSKESLLYVGGVTNACGFIGKIAEILVFNTPLNNTQTTSVVQHLRTKYSIPQSLSSSESEGKSESEGEVKPKNEKPIVLTTDSEAEIEITRSGVKTKTPPPEKEKPLTNIEKNQPPPETKPPTNTLPINREVRDEFAIERAEAESRKARKQSNGKPIEREMESNPNQVQNGKELIESEEEEKDSPSSESLSSVDTSTQKEPSERIRNPIVESPSAGVGGKGDHSSKDICSTNVDPYKDVPIETFTPPRNADLTDVLTWEDSMTDLKERIKGMTIGGKALRDIIKKEVRKMQILRFKTFCKYY